MFLMNNKDVSPDNWKKGRCKNFQFLGQLDHYDPTLKNEKCWEWTNLFVVHSDVNMKTKKDLRPNQILKPDEKAYDPFYFLEYDFKTNFLTANKELEFDLKRKVVEDINILGLNFQPIVDHRQSYPTPLIEDILLGRSTVQDAKASLISFQTAFEMSIKSIL